MFFLEIWILFAFSLLQSSRSYWLWHVRVTLWGFELISNYHHPFIEKQNLNHLRFTLLDTTVYLSQLPSPTPSHHLSSIRYPKCIRNEGYVIFFTRDCERNNKKHFQSVEIGNDILIYINIKRVFQMEIDYTRC